MEQQSWQSFHACLSPPPSDLGPSSQEETSHARDLLFGLCVKYSRQPGDCIRDWYLFHLTQRVIGLAAQFGSYDCRGTFELQFHRQMLEGVREYRLLRRSRDKLLREFERIKTTCPCPEKTHDQKGFEKSQNLQLINIH